MGVFRLGHISDLHLSQVSGRVNPLEGRSSYAAAQDAAKVFLKHRSLTAAFYPSTYDLNAAIELRRVITEDFVDLDALLVTGDIATTGEDVDLSVARSFFCASLPRWFNPRQDPQLAPLEVATFPILIMPGNHDRYEGITLTPGSLSFERYFGSHWDLDVEGTTYRIGGAHHRVRMLCRTHDHDMTALVVGIADLSLHTLADATPPFGYVGQGNADRTVLSELTRCTDTVLQEARDAGYRSAAIWAVHFPPSFPGIDRRLDLLNSDVLVDFALASNVRTIMAGHTHQLLCYRLGPAGISSESDITVYCSGATTGLGADGKLTFSVLDIEVFMDNGVRVSSEHHEYNPDLGVFSLATI